MREGKIYLYTWWRGLLEGEYDYVCHIYDGTGRRVFTNEMTFTSKKGRWRTWTWYDFNRYRDKPGTWRFEVFLDHEKVMEKDLEVLDADGRRYDPARIEILLQQAPLLAQSLARYKTLQSYQDSMVVEMYTVRPGMESRMTNKHVFAYARPNRLRYETVFGPMEGSIMVSDGVTTVEYVKAMGQYIERPVEDRMDPVFFRTINSGGSIVHRLLVRQDPARELLDDVETVVERGHEVLDGKSTTIVVLKQRADVSPWMGMGLMTGGGDIQLWIGNDDFMIHKILYTHDLKLMAEHVPEKVAAYIPMKTTYTERHVGIALNPTFAEETFVFVPLPNAERVDRLGAAQQTMPRKQALVGEAAPLFALKDRVGNQVKLADFQGQVVVLDFWATWCSPCTEQMPLLQALEDLYNAKGLTVLGLSIDDEVADVKTFAKRFEINFPLLMADEQVKRAYNVLVLPTTVLIDKQGMVRQVHQGVGNMRLQKQIEALLAE